VVRNPFISVVVPAFNAADTIEGTISSLLSQTGADFEVVVIDDCSNDNTLEVLRTIQESHSFKVLQNDENLGHGGSRNKGIDASYGQYIVFVDADDQLIPGSLEAIQRKLETTEPELLLIGVDEVKRGRQRRLTNRKLSERLEKRGTFQAGVEPVALFWPPATWSKVYKKDFLVQENIRFPDGFHQDIPWSALCTLKAQSIATLSRACYLYVRRGADSSTTNRKTTRTLIRVQQVRRIREGIDVHGLPKNLARHLVALATIHLLWGNKAAYRTIPEPLQEDFFHESAKELSEWETITRATRQVRSDSLFPTRERVKLAEALRSDDWERWRKALSSRRNLLRIKHYLQPSRWGIFKRS
jgi:CDP-glycerol glycerophosphotransferase